MVEIHWNVGGIEGLHLATNCFPEEVERRLFLSISEIYYQEGKRQWGGDPTGLIRWQYDWPDDFMKITNLVRDSGLVPDYVTPDYCLRLMYPPNARFQLHHDSKYRWGEVIMGVNLGQDGEMMFTPDREEDAFDEAAFQSEFAYKQRGRNKAMKVRLPRRSIYVMTGKSRYVYKHGIAKQKPIQPPPSWNPKNMRKSMTFRSTKVFSEVYLERLLQTYKNTGADATKIAAIQARKDAQDKLKPRDQYGTALTKPEVAAERITANNLLNMLDSGIIPAELRFAQNEVTPPLPSGVVGAQASQRVPAAASAPVPFQGEGRQLGSAAEDDDMIVAINESLRSLAADRAARAAAGKRKNDYATSSDGSPEKKGKGSGDTGNIIDLVDDDDDGKKEEDSVIVID